MMLSSLVRLPLIFISGIFIPAQPVEWLDIDPDIALSPHVPCRPVQRGYER